MPANKKNQFVQEIFTNNSIVIKRDNDGEKAQVFNDQGIRWIPPTTTRVVAKVGLGEGIRQGFIYSFQVQTCFDIDRLAGTRKI